jgi:simple sugar transport system permease protein
MEVQGFSRDMVVMLQGFIVLFSGAMAYVISPWVGTLIHWATRKPRAAASAVTKSAGGTHG